jgi:sodium-dependent phosphate cotransporter
LHQIFPYTVGANIGTTITALLASLVTGKTEALVVALAHFMFNSLGALLILSIPALRKIPLWCANAFSQLVSNHRYLALIYIATFFYLIPLLFIFFSSKS